MKHFLKKFFIIVFFVLLTSFSSHACTDTEENLAQSGHQPARLIGGRRHKTPHFKKHQPTWGFGEYLVGGLILATPVIGIAQAVSQTGPATVVKEDPYKSGIAQLKGPQEYFNHLKAPACPPQGGLCKALHNEPYAKQSIMQSNELYTA